VFGFGEILANCYERLVQRSCSEYPFPIPSGPQRYFINPYAFEYVEAIGRFVGGGQKVLVVGDRGGRDYYAFKRLGKWPVVMDIAQQSVIPEMVVADANLPFPFRSGTFDAVVMAEVIEHLPQDFLALREVRRVLKDDGTLVLTVPFFHDVEPTHIRVHSPASIERILSAAGWRIAAYIEKGGGLCRVAEWLPFRLSIHGFNALIHRLRGRTAYRALYGRIAALDFWLGGKRNSLHRWSRLYGAFIRCKKSEEVNWSALNCRAFQGMHRRLTPPIKMEHKLQGAGEP
jgi:SAM-dependent methyltransferase